MKFPSLILVTVLPATLKSAAVNSLTGALSKTTVAVLYVISLIEVTLIAFSANVTSTLTSPFTVTVSVLSS